MVFNMLKTILSQQLGVQENFIELDSSIMDDLGADSIDSVDLVMAAEDAFGIEVPDEDVERIITVEDAVTYIEEKMKELESEAAID